LAFERGPSLDQFERELGIAQLYRSGLTLSAYSASKLGNALTMQADQDLAALEGSWIVRVAFDPGDLRYYKSVDAGGPSDFTPERGDARRYQSERAAFDVVDRLKLRYPRIREIAVEGCDRSTAPR
jgi:hypothetical protein